MSLINEPKPYLFNGKTFQIKKMSIRQFLQLSAVLSSLTEKQSSLSSLFSGKAENILAGIAELLKTAPDVIAKATEVVCGIPAEDVMDATPEEVLDLLGFVWQLNDLVRMFEKKAAALKLPSTESSTAAAQPLPGSTAGQ